MAEGTPETVVPDDVIQRVEALLVRRVGFQLPRWLVSSRVGQRLKLRGGEAPEAWAARLEGPDGEAEVDALCEALRVGETSFFRHRAHIAAMRKIVVPDLAARLGSKKKVRAWSAGCASGEEAYTLALLLEEGLPTSAGWTHELVATDLSPDAIAIARRGTYAAAAARGVPADALARWFTSDGAQGGSAGAARGGAGGPLVTVRPELATRIRFEARNLLEPPPLRGADVIMCRNVLIYFEPEVRARTASRLVEALAPGGYLFLGYSESLRELDGLEPLRTDDGTVYRRPLRATPRAATPAPLPVRTPVARPKPTPPSPAPAPTPASAPAPAVLRLLGEVREPTRLARELSAAIARAPRHLVIDLDGATFLDDAIVPALRRALAAARAAGLTLELRAGRAGPRRFLARHHLGAPR